MKKVKTNLNRISVCIVIFSTVLCWTVYAGELEPVYKQKLPPWWEDGFEHQNFNPEMFDDFLQSGADQKPDGWELFDGDPYGAYSLRYIGNIDSDTVKIELFNIGSYSAGHLQQMVINTPDETNFKEFAFLLEFKTQDSFCPDTGMAFATFTVKIASDSEEKIYKIFEEGIIYQGIYEDERYYEVKICDRFKGQPESEVVSLQYETSEEKYDGPPSYIH